MQLDLWGYSLSELAAGKIQRQYWKWLFGMRYSSLINCIVNRLQHFATSWWLMCNDKCWMHWSTWLGFVNGLDHFLLYAYLLFISNSSVQAHLQKVVDGGCSAVPAVWCIHGINQNNGRSPHGLHGIICHDHENTGLKTNCITVWVKKNDYFLWLILMFETMAINIMDVI